MKVHPGMWAAAAAGSICLAAWVISVEVRLSRRDDLARAAAALEKAAEALHSRPAPSRPAPPVAERPRPAPAVDERPRPAPAVAERPRPAPPEGVRVSDTFEKGTDGWFIARFDENVIGELRRCEDAKEGEGALELSYELEEGKVPIAARVTPRLRWCNRITFWMRTTELPCELIVGVSEKDDSSYRALFHVEAAEGWKKLVVSAADLVLDDDSVDENGRLDPDQLQSVYILDAGGFFGREGKNRLLMDGFVCERVAEPAPAPAEQF